MAQQAPLFAGRSLLRLALLITLAMQPAHAKDKIDLVEFFGYQGIDLQPLRAALPPAPGWVFDEKAEARIRQTVKQITGRDATDVAPVCCNQQGNAVLFIGLAGKSSQPFRLNPKPAGAVRLPADYLKLMADLDREIEAAIRKGGDAPMEDDSQGYALIHYPPAQKLQIDLRDYARAHEAVLYDVLENSSDNYQRAQAAIGVGYAARSPRQIAALVHASRDPDAGVRDEAARALGVLLRSDASLAPQIPPADFIEMASSGIWMDRNKSSLVLDLLTRSRDPQLLARIEAAAWQPLLEMALWRDDSHAVMGRWILGRIRGFSEERVLTLSMAGPDAFLQAIGAK
jgi:hypothetical protein